MDEAEIAVGGFVISGGETPGVLELVEATLDHVAQGVDVGIDRELHEAVAPCRDHREAPAPFHILPNEISVIALVGQEHFGCRSVCVHDRPITLEVGNLTAGKSERYGQAHRIDAEMDLGRKATF